MNEKCREFVSEIVDYDLSKINIRISGMHRDFSKKDATEDFSGYVNLYDYLMFKEEDYMPLYVKENVNMVCLGKPYIVKFEVSLSDIEAMEKIEQSEINLSLALTQSMSGIDIDDKEPDYLDSLIKEKAKLISHFDKDFDPSILDDCFVENDYFFDDDDFEDYDEDFNLEKFQEKYSDDYMSDGLLDEDENVEIFLEKFSDKLDSMVRDVAQEMEEKNKEKLD